MTAPKPAFTLIPSTQNSGEPFFLLASLAGLPSLRAQSTGHWDGRFWMAQVSSPTRLALAAGGQPHHPSCPPATFTAPASGAIRHTDDAPSDGTRFYRTIPDP